MSERALELVRALKHLPGKHPQKSHAGGRGLHSDRKTVGVKTKLSGTVYVDEAIADTVKYMNDNGIRTGTSCSGHECSNVLESHLSIKPTIYDPADYYVKLQQEFDSKLALKWSVQPKAMGWANIQPVGGMFGTSELPSTRSNVQKSVDDWKLIGGITVQTLNGM